VRVGQEAGTNVERVEGSGRRCRRRCRRGCLLPSLLAPSLLRLDALVTGGA